jgi:hypothetical protein
MKTLTKAILAAITLTTMASAMAAPAAMAQQRPPVASAMGSGIPVPPEVPEGSTFLLFGPRHWGMTATVTGGRVPAPPSGAYGNFRFPDGKTWYSVSVTPPLGWAGTIRGGVCQTPKICPADKIDQTTYAVIAP